MGKGRSELNNRRKAQSSKLPPKSIYLVFLALMVIIPYARTINFDFVNIDDAVLIFENPLVTDSNIPYSKSFERFLFNVHYKPLVFLSWKAEYDLFGSNPWHFHLFNWLLHLANTFLVFVIGMALFRKLFSDEKKILFSAFALAALFTVNPLRIESVAWATERKDVLFSFFFLASWFLYIRYIEKKQSGLLIAGGLLYFLSGLSKSMGLTLIAVIAATDFWYQRKFNLRLILEKIPYLVFFLVLTWLYGLLQFGDVGSATVSPQEEMQEMAPPITSVESINSLPLLLQWLFTTSARFILWIIHSFIPVKLSVIYPHDAVFGFLGASVFISPLIIVLVYFWSWKKRKTEPALLAGMVFFLITMSPALALNSTGQAIFLSDRYTYIPSIGLFFILIAALNHLKFQSTRYYAAFGVLFLLYFTGTLINVNHWKNSEKLFTQALRVYPDSGMAHLNLGKYYREQNDLEKSLAIYTQGIQRAPGYYKLYSNRGKVYFDQGQIDQALRDYNQSLSLKPGYAVALANRAAVFGMKEQWDKALDDATKALEHAPNNTNALSNRGIIYYQTGEYEKTIADYQKYLEIIPDDPDIINTIGLCYARLGDYENAIRAYNRSIQLNPGRGAYFLNRSLALNAAGNRTVALKDAQHAQQLGFNVNPGYINQLKQQNNE